MSGNPQPPAYLVPLHMQKHEPLLISVFFSFFGSLFFHSFSPLTASSFARPDTHAWWGWYLWAIFQVGTRRGDPAEGTR